MWNIFGFGYRSRGVKSDEMVDQFAHQVLFHVEPAAIGNSSQDDGGRHCFVCFTLVEYHPAKIVIARKQYFAADGSHSVNAVMRVGSALVEESKLGYGRLVVANDFVHLIVDTIVNIHHPEVIVQGSTGKVFCNVYAFDVEVSAILKVSDKFCLVGCIYRPGRGEASTQAVTAHGGKYDVVAINKSGQAINILIRDACVIKGAL